MDRAHWSVVLVFLIILALAIGLSLTGHVKPNGNETPPDENQTNDQDQNTSSERPVYYFFWAPWCGYCALMQTYTLANESVVHALETNFTSTSVNVDKEAKLRNRYSIGPIPASVFTYANGTEIGRVLGYIRPDTFLLILEQVMEIYEATYEPSGQAGPEGG